MRMRTRSTLLHKMRNGASFSNAPLTTEKTFAHKSKTMKISPELAQAESTSTSDYHTYCLKRRWF